MPLSDPTFTTRQIDGLWHMVRTEKGKEQAYPAGTESHANLMASLAREPYERAAMGLPPVVRR